MDKHLEKYTNLMALLDKYRNEVVTEFMRFCEHDGSHLNFDHYTVGHGAGSLILFCEKEITFEGKDIELNGKIALYKIIRGYVDAKVFLNAWHHRTTQDLFADNGYLKLALNNISWVEDQLRWLRRTFKPGSK